LYVYNTKRGDIVGKEYVNVKNCTLYTAITIKQTQETVCSVQLFMHTLNM